MTTAAFQSNAFQNNAFQVGAVTAVAVVAAAGESGGGSRWEGEESLRQLAAQHQFNIDQKDLLHLIDLEEQMVKRAIKLLLKRH